MIVAKRKRGEGSTGPKHKTELDRDKTREEVARLQAFGLSPRQISARLGGRVSHVTVWKYLNEVGERYKRSQLESREHYVREKLNQYQLLRAEAYEAWERSKRSDDPDEVNAGDAVFLGRIADVLKAERELLGLDAPTKSDVRAAVASVAVGGVTGADGLPRTPDGKADWAALSGRPPVADPTDAADVPALPKHKGTE